MVYVVILSSIGQAILLGSLRSKTVNQRKDSGGNPGALLIQAQAGEFVIGKGRNSVYLVHPHDL